MAKKGIFCLETPLWYGIKDRTSIEPVLQLLEKRLKVPYLHHDVATIEEFNFYLEKWNLREFGSHPILYLAFHGDCGKVGVGERGGISLNDLAERLDGRCTGRVIHISSCFTLWAHSDTLNEFLIRTGALAVCGYQERVDWIESAAFDLLVLRGLQRVPFQRVSSMRKLGRDLWKEAPGLMKRLGFRIEVRQ